jgi:hypothetical protein
VGSIPTSSTDKTQNSVIQASFKKGARFFFETREVFHFVIFKMTLSGGRSVKKGTVYLFSERASLPRGQE